MDYPTDPIDWAASKVEKQQAKKTLAEQLFKTGSAPADLEPCPSCASLLKVGQTCPHCGLLAGY